MEAGHAHRHIRRHRERGTTADASRTGTRPGCHRAHPLARKTQPPHERLCVLRGEIDDAGAIARAIEGQDAVVCLLGAPLQDKRGVRASGTRQIVQAMQTAGVRRLVCLSSMGAGDSYAMIPRLYQYLVCPLFMERLFADHEAQEAEVCASGLDWVIARPSTYSEGTRSGDYAHGISGEQLDRKLRFKISRADVADFLLRQLTDDSYLRQAAWLTH